MRETAVAGPVRRADVSPAAARELGATLAAGFLLALIGPFGTFAQAGLGERLVYWIGVMLIAFVVYRPACALAGSAASARGRSEPLGWAVAVVAATLPVTLLVWLASYRHTPSLWPSPGDFLSFYGSVFTIGAGLMTVVWLIGEGRRAVRPPEPGPSEPAPPTRALERLGLDSAEALVALEMEDHYLRIHTRAGSTLRLMRMRDALEAAAAVEGAQVHRSWWVARHGVAAVHRSGRRLRVTLANGLVVPVSRDRLAGLPEWLRPDR